VSFQKNVSGKSQKIRNSAKGRDCTVRIPGICNHNPETVVLAHMNGGGAGMKVPDWEACYACSNCHDAIDRRLRTNMDYTFYHYQACQETRQILFNEGYLKIA